MIGTLDPSSFFGFGNNNNSLTSRRHHNRLAPLDTSSPVPERTRPGAAPKPFSRTATSDELKEYIVRFRQGTGTDDIREIEKMIDSQGGKYKRRGSLSQDLDCDLPVVSLRYLADKSCVERLVKRQLK